MEKYEIQNNKCNEMVSKRKNKRNRKKKQKTHTKHCAESSLVVLVARKGNKMNYDSTN